MPLGTLVTRFGLRVLVAAEQRPRPPEVGWLHRWDGTSESRPDALHAGDLVVTTSSAVTTADDAAALVAAAVSAGAAAICVDAACPQDRVALVVTAAEPPGLPVLALPPGTEPRELAMAIAEQRVRIDAAKARRVAGGLVALTDALAMNGVPGVVVTLAAHIDGWATLVDKYGQVVTTVGAGRVHVDDAVAAATAGTRRRRHPGLQVFPVGRSDSPKARLVVAARPQLDDEARELALHAARLIDLGFFPSVGSHVWPLARRDAVDVLLTDHPVAPQIARRWALRGDSFVVSVLRSRSRAVLLEEAALSWITDLGLPPLVAADGSDVQVIVSADAVADWQGAVVAASDAGVPVRCGIGGERPLADLRLSHRQARQALEVAIADSRSVVRFADLETMRILLSGLGADAVSALGEPLRALADAGPGSDSYLTSLRVFLAENGNWGAASAQLRIHRHTLRHRIERVQELTGLDMTSAEDRFRAWVALRALDAAVED